MLAFSPHNWVALRHAWYDIREMLRLGKAEKRRMSRVKHPMLRLTPFCHDITQLPVWLKTAPFRPVPLLAHLRNRPTRIRGARLISRALQHYDHLANDAAAAIVAAAATIYIYIHTYTIYTYISNIYIYIYIYMHEHIHA